MQRSVFELEYAHLLFYRGVDLAMPWVSVTIKYQELNRRPPKFYTQSRLYDIRILC